MLDYQVGYLKKRHHPKSEQSPDRSGTGGRSNDQMISTSGLVNGNTCDHHPGSVRHYSRETTVVTTGGPHHGDLDKPEHGGAIQLFQMEGRPTGAQH